MSIDTATSDLDTSLFLLDLRHRRPDSVLAELASFAHGRAVASSADRLTDALARRERLYSSAVGKGVAIPHVRSLVVSGSALLLARSTRGVEWKARDAQPVHLVLAVLAPPDLSLEAFHERIARTVAVARLQRHRQRMLAARSPEECRAILAEVAS